MKKAGLIFIVFGILAFIGAASKGHSVFGPLFWIGLGGVLIYLKKEKDETWDKAHLESKSVIQEQNKATQEVCDNYSIEDTSESEHDLPLSSKQKEASLCLIAFFAGYNDDIMTNDVAYMVACQSATFFGIDNYKETLMEAMPKFNDPDILIDTVLTIKDKKTKEFLLLSCYDLAKMSDKEEAYELLYNIANDMGYNRDRLTQLINQYLSKPQNINTDK